jgi:hypothetical protein
MTNDRTSRTPESASEPAAAATVWTAQRIRALGAVTDLQTTAAIFGLSRTTAYELARTDQLPVPVLRFGARYRVPVHTILTALGLPNSEDEPTAARPTRAGEPATGGRLDPGPDPRVDHPDRIRCRAAAAPPPDQQGEA